MSKKTPIQRVAESIWYNVLHDHGEYFQKPWEVFFLNKLKKAKFTKQGTLRMDSIGQMISMEFPQLYKFWKERMNAKDNA